MSDNSGIIALTTIINPKHAKMTRACLVDRLKKHLATIEDTSGKYDDRKYYDEAHDMLKIGIFKPVPEFIVYLADLTPELIKELHRSELRARGWKEEKSLEIPNGPCLTFRDPASNSIVIYENQRPHVMSDFKGRIDID